MSGHNGLDEGGPVECRTGGLGVVKRRKRTRKFWLVLGLVYVLVLAAGVAALYLLVPSEVWRTIRAVYFRGEVEDF